MSTKDVILAVLLSTSIAVNVILIQERFERKLYDRGLADGVTQISEKLVAEVQKNQAINVKMPDGKQLTLATLGVFQKQLAARQAQRVPAPSPPGDVSASHPGGSLRHKLEAPIDTLKGTIDNPKE